MKKKTEANGRAAVSKERRLALALVAVIDELGDKNVESLDAVADANSVLFALGYDGLQGIPKQVAALTAELKAATEAGEWAKVAVLGEQLKRVQSGKAVKSVAPVAVKKSYRKRGAAGSTVNIATDTGDASSVGNEDKNEAVEIQSL